MHNSILTLVAARENDFESRVLSGALDILKSCRAEGVSDPVLLAPGKAADILFQGGDLELLRQRLDLLPHVDFFLQPNDGFRRKKLLMADMDATIVQGETLDEMAAHFDLKDKIAPITARAMQGEIDFAEALRLRVGLLKGMPIAAVEHVVEGMRYAPGAEELIRTMSAFGARCVLISGGFDMFTGRAARTLGFHKNFANRLRIADGVLMGEVIPPLVDKDFKKKTTEDEAYEMSIDLRHVMAVGDGANDIPMLQTAGTGVGYFGKPAVQAATPHQVRYTDLTALLYMQGYRQDAFIC
jgi:phosphoserine phosphatase